MKLSSLCPKRGKNPMSNPGKCAYACAPRVFGALSKCCKPNRPLSLLLGKGGRGGGKRPISVPFSLSLLFDGAASPYVLQCSTGGAK